MGYPETIIAKERLVGRVQRENFRKALLAGCQIAYGTDSGVYPHGWNGKQFVHMVRWGMTPMQAIQSATTGAADLLGWKDKVGQLAPASSPTSSPSAATRSPTSPYSKPSRSS